MKCYNARWCDTLWALTTSLVQALCFEEFFIQFAVFSFNLSASLIFFCSSIHCRPIFCHSPYSLNMYFGNEATFICWYSKHDIRAKRNLAKEKWLKQNGIQKKERANGFRRCWSYLTFITCARANQLTLTLYPIIQFEGPTSAANMTSAMRIEI